MYGYRFNLLCALAFSASLVCGGAVSAQELAQERDLGALSCKDVMRLSGQDREIALALAHGYVLGKNGTTKYRIPALAAITDRFVEYCLDHPTENALQSFEKLAK